MKQIPETEYALVLRTDVSDQAAWEEICAEIPKRIGLCTSFAFTEVIHAIMIDLTE